MEVRKLNVGCGRDVKEGWDNLDRKDLEGVKFIVDMDTAKPHIPVEANTYDEIYCSHMLEHVHNILPCVEELHRVAKPGAELHIRVPHGASETAFEDPTHVRNFFPRSFMYFGQPYYHLADYGYRGDWKVRELILMLRPTGETVPKEQELDYMKWLSGQWNAVEEIYAVLEAVKPIRDVREPHDRPRMGLKFCGENP